LTTVCRVPASLEAVTSVGHEVPPRDAGADPQAIRRAWDAVERLYRSGMHPAIQLCVRRAGAVVIDRAIGHASGNAPDDPPGTPQVPVTTATPFNIFSAAKAVTAMVVHILDQGNLVRLDDPLCEYIPEFAVRTKQWITLRHVLTHRAGLANVPPEMMQLERLDDPDGIVRVICALEQTGRPGRQLAYHAITGGFILGELVRRVTGLTIRTFLDEAIARPLGFRWLGYGVRPEDVAMVAQNAFTGPPPPPPLAQILRRALGVGLREAIAMSNDPRFLTAIVPAANVIATAEEMSRFYQLLLNGGELDGVRVFDPRTIRRATSEQSYLEFDFTLLLPFRYGLGFMLGGAWFSPYGPDTRYAYGHIGLSNILTWADPERRVAAALLTSGKPIVYPALYHLFEMLRHIGNACPKVAPGRAASVAVPSRASAAS
jgi:CubicO group peptidase (beta-lactamase class C family)